MTLAATMVMILLVIAACGNEQASKKRTMVGVYYFDGWSGKHRKANDPNEPWAKNAPTHLTIRLLEDFPEREPVWGWRSDSQEIMERQIDLAADNGIDFFLFCWYWKDDGGPINLEVIKNDPKHTSLGLYLKAKNKHRVKFGLLIANHRGYDIKGPDNWEVAVKHWMQYFNDPQHVTVDGKPLVVIFGSGDGIDNECLARMQETAKKEGLKNGLSIAGCGEPAMKKSGFTHSTHYNLTSGYSAASEEHKYQELIDNAKKRWVGTEEQPHMPLLNCGWDKRPWEGPRGQGTVEGWYFPDSSPELFGNFIKDAIQWMDDNPTKATKERIILIYAWNENGEGGYLVPTKGDPNAEKLKMIKSIVLPE